MIGQLTTRVLLVDDEPLIRKLISRYLVAAGYVVRAADDGLDAIGKLRGGLPDLIISDLKMPRMSGFELLDVVRKRFPQIPVIVISGAVAEEMSPSVAADAYCPKNEFLSEQLLQIISDLKRKPPPRTAPPDVGDQPTRASCDRDGNYVIGCDDCLREFRVSRFPHVGGNENRTLCVHCGKVVQFVVTEREVPH
jgi:CheY-like chemotaxis protein